MFTKWKIKKLKKKIRVLMEHRLTNTPSDDDLRREIALHHELGKLYDSLRFHKKFPYADRDAIESYRVAANLEDVKAQFIVGQRLLELGKFWDTYVNSLYKTQTIERYATSTYEEALGYLRAAQGQGSAEAIRLLGLAHINAWGVPQNQNAGFKLVVESIEIENAWGRATEIFKQIGLNKPEFFASIMSMRGQNKHD